MMMDDTFSFWIAHNLHNYRTLVRISKYYGAPSHGFYFCSLIFLSSSSILSISFPLFIFTVYILLEFLCFLSTSLSKFHSPLHPLQYFHSSSPVLFHIFFSFSSSLSPLSLFPILLRCDLVSISSFQSPLSITFLSFDVDANDPISAG